MWVAPSKRRLNINNLHFEICIICVIYLSVVYYIFVAANTIYSHIPSCCNALKYVIIWLTRVWHGHAAVGAIVDGWSLVQCFNEIMLSFSVSRHVHTISIIETLQVLVQSAISWRNIVLLFDTSKFTIRVRKLITYLRKKNSKKYPWKQIYGLKVKTNKKYLKNAKISFTI